MSREGHAQDTPAPADDAAGVTTLAPVVVTATRTPEELNEVPASVSVIGKEEIERARPTVSIAESLPCVPGVLAQDSGNFAQDARIQIRGFGTRAAFGIREIRVLVDGLPETLPDGQTELDDVDMGAIDRIEVLRGAASALYGNASGGLIQLFTEDPPDRSEGGLRFTFGSYGLLKTEAKAGTQAGPVGVSAHLSYLESDGYRHHSDAASTILTSKLRYRFEGGDEDDGVQLLLNAVAAPVGEDPGGLTRPQTQSDPRQAALLNLQQDAGEDVTQARAGVVLRRRLGNGRLTAYVYDLYRNFDNRLPIPPDTPPIQGGVVRFNRTSPGAGAQYTFDGSLLRFSNRLTLGFDVQHQNDERRRYANIAGTTGDFGLRQHERVTSVGPYVRDAFALTDELELSVGVRYDWFRYDVDVQYPADDTNGGHRALTAWSPAGGLAYTPLPWLSTYVSIGTAFQVPTTTELANPAGAGFNPDVDPQTATSYEVGVRLERERFSGALAGFWIDVDDELVPYELASQPGRTFFRNAGRSRRYGMEWENDASLGAQLHWRSALTLISAHYERYVTEAGGFDGRREPGIPQWQVFQELRYGTEHGAYVALEAFLVGRSFVDDANTIRSRSTSLLNLRASYPITWTNLSIEPFLGITNLLDDTYDARLRLNAVAGRYFEPGAGIGIYAGLAIYGRRDTTPGS